MFCGLMMREVKLHSVSVNAELHVCFNTAAARLRPAGRCQLPGPALLGSISCEAPVSALKLRPTVQPISCRLCKPASDRPPTPAVTLQRRNEPLWEVRAQIDLEGRSPGNMSRQQPETQGVVLTGYHSNAEQLPKTGASWPPDLNQEQNQEQQPGLPR